MATFQFLTADDVNSRIRAEHLSDLVDLDLGAEAPDPSDTEAYQAYQDAIAASDAIQLSAESMALAKVRSALHGRFNTATLFGAVDPDRNRLRGLHVLNVYVYLLYRRINPRKIPQEVKDDHDETLAWLDRVSAGKETPDFPSVQEDDNNAGLPRFGGGHEFGGFLNW